MLQKAKRWFRLQCLKIKWKKKNRDNDTFPINVFPANRVIVGKGTYGGIKAITFDYEEDNKLIIGNYCSISMNVSFILGGAHDYNRVSTFPFDKRIARHKSNFDRKENIVIEDDVWIGYNATILSGIHIGQGAVVASGAVVVHDVPPYSIVGGVPARIIKKRFTDEVIEYLLRFDYSALKQEVLLHNINDMDKEINRMSLDQIQGLYSWFPRKNG